MKRLIAFILVFVLMIISADHVVGEEQKVAPMKKLRIAVMDMETKARGVDHRVGDVLSEMVITALVKTGKYIVLERSEIHKVLREQDLGSSGAVTAETAVKAGKLLGAQVVVTGTITEYTWFSSGGGIIIKGIGLGSKNAKLTIDLRLVDTTTGEIITAESASGTSTSTALGAGAYVDDIWIAGGFGKNDPMGKAVRDAVGKIVEIISKKTGDIPWQARIVKRDGEKIYMNIGKNGNIRPDEVFTVYSRGEELIDPETGLSLGAEEKQIGRIRITDVKEKYSIGKIIDEYKETAGTIKRGDIIREK
ncbi:MAG: hypothetical protein J7M18_05375 [Candidatus Eremiobacteraeota bacterium]|nr:hypothetical protein [Candidatus Eremiobacteraeota bacterium]